MELSQLNSAQREAVLTIDGPVMILAGAGSGKTRTLVTRMSYLLKTKRIPPYEMLALTFSNKAAKEMRERIMLDTDESPLVTTFHSFCTRILRGCADLIGLSKNFTIYDELESRAVIKGLMPKHGFSPKDTPPKAIKYYIDEMKNQGFYVGKEGDWDVDDDYYPLFLDYQNELAKSNATDFGGLIAGVLELFDKHPDILLRYQKQYRYLLVDEYQDTNHCQFELIRRLAENGKNICVVGDEDQSIYSWRGADIRNILDFEQYFPETKVIKLEQNYRSSQVIISAATAVISNNKGRYGKKLWTDNDEGDLVNLVECQSEKEEGQFVATQIQTLIQEGIGLKDVAVFYRNNAQSRILEEWLRRLRISYRIVGGMKFFERREVKDMLSYLRLLVNPQDSLALARIINIPARGIGAVTLRKLETYCTDEELSLFELLDQIKSRPEIVKQLRLSGKIQNSLKDFINLIQEGRKAFLEGESPSSLYEALLQGSGYLALLEGARDYESKARLENLEELYNALRQYEDSAENPRLDNYLETLSLDVNYQDAEEEKGELALMTVHGSKGLEFPYVFIVGAEENIFPSYRGIEQGTIEEERRLFYVAMTRCMKQLWVSYAKGRMLFGKLQFNGPSRFLYEMPSELVDWQKETEEMEEVGRYSPGHRVRHKLYGEGIVVSREGSGHDEKVVIQFPTGEKKRFMVEYAPLEELE